MRVLITTDVVGGVWTYTSELADALQRRGHAVALVAFGGAPAPAQRAWAEARPWLRFTALDHPLEWMPEPDPGLAASLDPLRAEVAEVEPDVVHLNQFYYGAFDLGAPKLLVAHSDVVTWWRAVKGSEPPDDEWFRRYQRRVREGLAGADLLAAPSEWMASAVEAGYGASAVRTVHNGRSPARFRADADRRRSRRVVTAGRLWDEAKGARDLIPAAGELDPAAEVVVAGETIHPAGGDDFPADAPGVRWAGVLEPDALRDLLAGARVYAATSRYEPFGLTPLEATLSGCALVAADIPTFRELWDGCAAFYPPGDTGALAEALRGLLDGRERRTDLAARARARAVRRYSPERMAAGYEHLYREAAGSTPPLRERSPATGTAR